MVNPLPRALLCLGLLAGAATASSRAFAQSPAPQPGGPLPTIPATGHPPPPAARAAEGDAIWRETQARVASERARGMWTEAQQAVYEERRRAWESRGRHAIPPAITSPSLPTFEIGLDGSIRAARRRDVGLGIGASLSVRWTDWWGLSLGAGVLAARGRTSDTTPDDRVAAVSTDASAFLAVAGNASYASRLTLRAGVESLIPFGDARFPAVYVAPFLGAGVRVAVATFVDAYVAMGLELRGGYRVGIGRASTSPLEGGYVEAVVGPVIGF
jgi:hypothetical protein